MKISKVIRINDGNPEMLTNEGKLFVEEYSKMENVINQYLQEGWEVKQIVALYEPSDRGIPFYIGGQIVYFEKEV